MKTGGLPSDEEATLLEVRAALARILKNAGVERHWTQAQPADVVGFSRSRVAKMEAGDKSAATRAIQEPRLS